MQSLYRLRRCLAVVASAHGPQYIVVERLYAYADTAYTCLVYERAGVVVGYVFGVDLYRHLRQFVRTPYFAGMFYERLYLVRGEQRRCSSAYVYGVELLDVVAAYLHLAQQSLEKLIAGPYRRRGVEVAIGAYVTAKRYVYV